MLQLPICLQKFAMLRRGGWLAAVRIFLLVLLAANGLNACRAAAEENPFGLPAARDAGRPGFVMLHGGGHGLRDEVRQEFVRLAGGRDARIVIMPSDSCQLGKDEEGNLLPGGETAEAYEQRLSQPHHYGRCVALRENRVVAEMQFLYRDPVRDAGDSRFYSLLDKATGVWLPAYDQAWLPEMLAGEYPRSTSRFQLALREVVARGGVVGALGGGAACMPETVIASNHVDGDGWIRAKLRFGLALFDGAVVDQNFSSHAGRLERLTDLLRNGPALDRLEGTAGVQRKTIGLGIERQTVLILSVNTVRAMGEGRGHVFLKSHGDRTITWRTIAAGDDPLVVRSGTELQRRPNLAASALEAESLNPFGLPGTDESSPAGTVILHGGGSTREMLDLLPKLTNKAQPRIVHCPAARESCRPSAKLSDEKLGEWLEKEFAVWRQLQTQGRISNLAFFTTSNRADANRAEFVDPLTRADGVWFCGGDQRPLAELFVDGLRPTLVQEAIANVLRRGGVVGGSSAGLATMPEIMIEGGDSIDGRPAEAALSRGLGVLKHVLAEQHFDARAGRIERFTGLLRDHKRLANFWPECRPKRMIGLAVEEDTALVVQGNRVRVVGKKLAHVFLQASDPTMITWHALKPGDGAVVRAGLHGPELELDDWFFE